MKHKYTGASLSDLLKKFGKGEKGFYNSWWKDEPFAKEKSPRKTYEIVFHQDWNNMTYQEQADKAKEAGEELLHPAVLAEAILTHYKKTGERLMENWWSRTSALCSGGSRVSLGSFDSDGLGVHDGWDGGGHDGLGLASVRKFSEPLKLETGNLEKRVEELEKFREKVEAVLNL